MQIAQNIVASEHRTHFLDNTNVYAMVDFPIKWYYVIIKSIQSSNCVFQIRKYPNLINPFEKY